MRWFLSMYSIIIQEKKKWFLAHLKNLLWIPGHILRYIWLQCFFRNLHYRWAALSDHAQNALQSPSKFSQAAHMQFGHSYLFPTVHNIVQFAYAFVAFLNTMLNTAASLEVIRFVGRFR